MPQDAFTLRSFCRELDEIFVGGKINRITQPNDDEVYITVFTGKSVEKLTIDVNPSRPRIGVSKAEKDSPLTAPNFCMLLRKHLLMAEIVKIELVGYDRIVKIICAAASEFKNREEKTLIVELMGRYSNVILTEGGLVLGANRGINMIYNGVRPLISGKPYVLPPVQNKKIPSDETLIDDFRDISTDKPLYSAFTELVQGVSTATAQELIFLFEEQYGAFTREKAESFFKFQKSFLYGEQSQPCVLISGGTAKDAFVFPYKTASGELKFFDKTYQAEDFCFSQKNLTAKFNEYKSRLTAKVNSALKKHRKKLFAFLSKEKESADFEEMRVKGELILSNIYKIKTGDKTLQAENYYDGGKRLEIELNEFLSPSKNAEAYYKKYNKKKRTLELSAPQKEQTESEIAYLTSVLDEINSALTAEDLSAIEDELKVYGLIQSPRAATGKKKKETSPYRQYNIDGFTVKAGRNNVENDSLTFGAKPLDVWLHAKDYHSSHVIIESDGKTVPESVIIKAAEICAFFSPARGGGKTEIAYTLKKHVKKPRGAKPGFVIYDNFSTAVVCSCSQEDALKSN